MGKRILICALFFGLTPWVLRGQSMTEQIYACYIGNDMVEWVKVMEEMKDVYEVTGSMKVLTDVVLAQYGYIAICVAKGDKKEGKAELKEAERNVEILLGHNPDWADMYALKGALLAFKIGFDPYKFVIYGSMAKQQNETAMKLNAASPNVWMEKGNLEMYWPDLQRNDAKHAVDAYSRSMQLFEESEILTTKNWLYLNTMISLANAYCKAELYDEADEMYRKILRVEPDIVWIRDRDYPRFREKYLSS